MPDYFHIAWDSVRGVEKGYVNNPNDSGGPTNFGVTERVARKYGFTGDMKDLPQDLATTIAKKEFWDVMRLDEVADIHPSLAFKLFGTGFLTGSSTSVIFLQEALNALNRQGKDYPDMKIDGVIGGETLTALRKYYGIRHEDGIRVLLRVLHAELASYLLRDVKARPKDEDFFYGWILNRVDI